MSLTDMERTFRAFVAEGSQLATSLVIPADDNGPRIKEPYASVNRIGNTRAGYPIDEQLADGTVLAANRQATEFSINWYRQGAHDRGFRFVQWVESELGLEYAAERDFAVIDYPIRLRDLDEIVGNDYEERIQAEVTIEWVSTMRQSPSLVEHIIGTYEGTRLEAERRS